MYAKLIDGNLIHAPCTLKRGGKVHYHPSRELYRKFGWLTVVETPAPEADEDDPKYYEPHWAEQGDKIVRVWTEAEPPKSEAAPDVPDMPSVEARVSALEEAMLYMMGGDALV